MEERPNRLKTILKDVVLWFVHEIRESGSTETIERELITPIMNSILAKLVPYIVASSIIFVVIIVSMILGITWLLPKLNVSTANSK